MKEKIVIIIFCFASFIIYSQKNRNDVFLKAFVKDLFDNSISEKDIVKNYLVKLKKDKQFSNSVEQRKENQLNHIKVIRNNEKNEHDWLMPGRTNSNYKNHIAPYSDFQHLDTISWAGKPSKKIKDKMFVLLSKDKDTILQYFLLKQNRIKSYTLFVKSKEALFFEY